VGVKRSRILIFISQWLDAIVGLVEDSPINAAAPQSPIRIDNSQKLHTLTLYGYVSNFLELAPKKPHVSDKN